MSSNRLHKIFNTRKGLTRNDLHSYGKSNDQNIKNDIEQKAMSSSFNQDALEGWSELSYDTSALRNLDKTYFQPSNLTWYLVGIATIGIVVIIYLNPFTTNQNATNSSNDSADETISLNENQEIVLEETDLMFPSKIEKMHVVSRQKQILPEKIKEEFTEILSFHTNDLAELPIIELEQNDTRTILNNRKNAKEIYLYDLKLIDYRAYRSKPTVKTKQVILSGTPANLETTNSDDVVATWKIIDIPYIDYIKKSVRIFGRGNFKKALSRFEIILNSYPTDVNANFYSGLCLFNFGEYTNAIKSFSKCIESPFINFDEESLWMIAMSHENDGNHTASKKLFKQISDAKGYYAIQAKDILNQ